MLEWDFNGVINLVLNDIKRHKPEIQGWLIDFLCFLEAPLKENGLPLSGIDFLYGYPNPFAVNS